MQIRERRIKLVLIAAALPLMAGICNAPINQARDIGTPTPFDSETPLPTEVGTQPATVALQPSATAAPATVRPTAIEEAHVTHDGITLFYDPNLILDIFSDTIPAVLEPGPFEEAHPEYVAFNFILDAGSLSVVRVQDYSALSESADEELQRLQDLLAVKPSQAQDCVPQPALSAFYTTCSHQQFNANIAYVDFQNGSGVRFVTVYAIQDAVPVSNEHLTYMFQGFTDDGRYYVSAGFHITHQDLEEFIAAIPQEVSSDMSGAALAEYFEGFEAMLNANEDRFQPLLSRFDQMLSSLRVAD